MDVFDLPRQQSAGSRVFYANGQWQAWSVPRGASWLYGILIGGGASGQGAFAGTGFDPGVGGGSATITKFFIPLLGIDLMFFNVGRGGAAVTSSQNAGGATSVSLSQSTATSYLLATAPGGASDTAGAASTSGIFNTLGQVLSIGGQKGAAAPSGGGDNAGLNVTWGAAGIPLSGGASGAAYASGGSGAQGGSVVLPSGFSTVSGGAAGAGAGANGYNYFKPMMFFGGAGGGSNPSGSGGRGGNGGYGCGGGGSSGYSSGNAGLSGRGGDGLAMLWWW